MALPSCEVVRPRASTAPISGRLTWPCGIDGVVVGQRVLAEHHDAELVAAVERVGPVLEVAATGTTCATRRTA